jgi:PEP-CTERM motif
VRKKHEDRSETNVATRRGHYNKDQFMKTSLKILAGVTSLAGLLIGNAVFAQNLIQNPGFETGDLTGWLVLNAGNASVQSPDNGPSAPGTHNAFLDNQFQANNLALQQTTAAGSVGGGVLVLYSFDLQSGISLNGGVNFVHIFEQNASGGVIGSGPGLLGPLFPPTGANQWQTYSGSFTTVAGTDHLTIEFDATTGAAAGTEQQVHIDNVVLSPVPEPTSLSLAAIGLLGAWTIRRRRKA